MTCEGLGDVVSVAARDFGMSSCAYAYVGKHNKYTCTYVCLPSCVRQRNGLCLLLDIAAAQATVLHACICACPCIRTCTHQQTNIKNAVYFISVDVYMCIHIHVHAYDSNIVNMLCSAPNGRPMAACRSATSFVVYTRYAGGDASCRAECMSTLSHIRIHT